MTKVQSAATEAMYQLRNATSHFELAEALARLGAMIGCHHFLMVPAPNCALPEPKNLLTFSNYPKDLMDYYQTEQSALSDPCRNIAILQTGVVFWRKVFQEAKGGKEREFIRKMRENGIKDGISMPIYGSKGCIAILNYASGQILDFQEDDDEALLLVAIVAHQRIKQFLAKSLIPPSDKIILTTRELECLQWVIVGKTNWEIGVLMGISPRTVQFHLSNCQNKLGVTNRIQAVVKALVNNIIKPRANLLDNILQLETKGANETNNILFTPNMFG